MSRLRPSDENKYGGKWSLQKLECVASYLDSYLTVMQNQRWAKLWYIDAFSGDGYQTFKDIELDDETLPLLDEAQSCIEAFTSGSAMRAIELSSKRESCGKRAFDRFVFLEYSATKIESLRKRIAVRCKRNGWDYLYTPELQVIHFDAGSTGVLTDFDAGCKAAFHRGHEADSLKVLLDYMDGAIGE